MPSQKYASTAAACDQVESLAPGSVVLQGSAEYQAEMEKSWTPNCWLPASGFVKPRSAAEVARVLGVLRQTGTKFAVRCTGHNQNAGVAGVGGDGVVVDVSRLRDLSLDDDDDGCGGVLRAGAGCTWDDVYGFLGRRGRSAVGGRHKHVGVAGFTLGGGMPAFVNLHGYGADSVKAAEVVLADSSVVRASATENPDLLWALKGGGANFGIVTSFEIQTVPLVQARYRINLYSPTDLVSIQRASVQLQKSMETDPNASMYVSFLSKFVAVGFFYASWDEEADKLFEPFAKLDSLLVQEAVPPTNGDMKSLVYAIGPDFPSLRRYASCVVTKVSEELFVGIDGIVAKARAAHPKLLEIVYTNQPVSPRAVEIGEARGGNCMGMERISQSVWVFVAEWDREEDDAEAERAIDGVQRAVSDLAEQQGQGVKHVFMNDASKKQRVLESYGEANFRRLRETAARFDPDGIFQTLQNDGFLIRRSLA